MNPSYYSGPTCQVPHTQPSNPDPAYWPYYHMGKEPQLSSQDMSLNENTTNAENVNGQNGKVTFTWNTKLAQFWRQGYQLSAAEGLSRGDAVKDLVLQLEKDYQVRLADLNADFRKKAKISVYDSYREKVEGKNMRHSLLKVSMV